MTATKTPGSLTPTSTTERTKSTATVTARKRRLNCLLGLMVVAALTLGMLHQSNSRAQQAGDGTATPEASPDASPGASPAVVITPAPDARQLKLTFTELNDSGVTGTTTLYDAGNRTIVDIDVKNTGADHPSHIHKGTCGQLDGQIAYTLASVHEDGKSRSVVDASLDDLLAGGYAIDLHLSPAELGTLIDCVDITGEPAVPGTIATPSATATATATDAAAPTTTPVPSATSAGGTSTETPSPTESASPTTTPTITVAAIGGDGTSGSTSGNTIPTSTQEVAATTSQSSSGSGSSIGTGSGTATGSGSTTGTTSQTTTVGDGTGGDVTTVSFAASSSDTTTTNSLANTGSGPMGMLPGNPIESMIWAMSSFALILLMSGIWIWRGERRHGSHRQPPRWSRLGM